MYVCMYAHTHIKGAAPQGCGLRRHRKGAACVLPEGRGKHLHTKNHTSKIPLENATDNPLETSSNNSLDK